MNLLDVTVSKLLDEPKHVIDEEYCCWAVTIVSDCCGTEKREIVRKCSRTEIDRIKPGYILRRE